MVDPNRKINRLSDDDAAFLVECEQEFRNRYTNSDAEFTAFLAKPTRPPPIVDPWPNKQMNKDRHHGDSGNNWNRNNYRHNNRNNYNRNNDNRDNRPNAQRNYRQHYNRPYDRNFRRDGGDGNSGHGSSYPY